MDLVDDAMALGIIVGKTQPHGYAENNVRVTGTKVLCQVSLRFLGLPDSGPPGSTRQGEY